MLLKICGDLDVPSALSSTQTIISLRTDVKGEFNLKEPRTETEPWQRPADGAVVHEQGILFSQLLFLSSFCIAKKAFAFFSGG